MRQIEAFHAIYVSGSISGAARVLNVSQPSVISAQTFFVAAALVRHGAGIAIVDEPTAYAMCDAQMDFKSFDPPMRFSVCAIHLEDRPLSQLARSFVQIMRDQVLQAQATHNRSL